MDATGTKFGLVGGTDMVGYNVGDVGARVGTSVGRVGARDGRTEGKADGIILGLFVGK